MATETKKQGDMAWSQRDETNFINGLGSHTVNEAIDTATIETLLNRYRLALCKRASNGVAGFSIKDALNVVDRRLDELQKTQARASDQLESLNAA